MHHSNASQDRRCFQTHRVDDVDGNQPEIPPNKNSPLFEVGWSGSENRMICDFFYIAGGAGFLPSTVWIMKTWAFV